MKTALFSDRVPKMIVLSFARRLQGLDFALAGEHHLDQPIGVAGEIFGAKRYGETLAENALNRWQMHASLPTLCWPLHDIRNNTRPRGKSLDQRGQLRARHTHRSLFERRPRKAAFLDHS